MSDTALKAIATQCSEFARTLPCDGATHPDCISQSILSSHSSTRRATTTGMSANESELCSLYVSKYFLMHFARMLSRLFPLSKASVFFKSIGSKHSTFAHTMIECLDSLKKFDDAFKLSELDADKVWVDHCITTSADCPDSPVTL